jgi:hypothetical protein
VEQREIGTFYFLFSGNSLPAGRARLQVTDATESGDIPRFVTVFSGSRGDLFELRVQVFSVFMEWRNGVIDEYSCAFF